MTFLLRHSLFEHMDKGGWVDTEIVLSQLNDKNKEQNKEQNKNEITLQTIVDYVKNDTKQRFQIKDNKIRAVQGHSKNNILEDDYMYTKLTINNIQTLKPILHFTFKKNLDSIMQNGLQPINRECIHFVPNGDKNLARKNTNCILEFDAEKWILSGNTIYQAANNVILVKAEKIDFAEYLKIVKN
jgi:RNA:NAD 2'-phosphotransferase (TPT1/KptA family)